MADVDDPRVIAQMREMRSEGTPVEDYGAFLRMAKMIAGMLDDEKPAPKTPEAEPPRPETSA
jgi:hypothetical protein